MYRLTLLAGLIASAVTNANDSPLPYQARPEPILPAVTMKARERDISDLYFIHFKGEPLSVAAHSLQSVGIQTMHSGSARLNVKAPASQQYLARLAQDRASVRQQLNQTLGRSLQFEREYGTVINAATVRLSEEEAAQLRRHKAITLVDKVNLHQLHTDSGPEFIGADKLWQGQDSDLPTKGEGVIVGIIDTGIDADHPSFTAEASDGYVHTNPLGSGVYLGDCQTHDWICNDKLIGVVSYPELRNWYPASPVEGFERPEIIETGWDMQGHGTHVASTAAGNPLTDLPIYNVLGDLAQFRMPAISGVAPRANIVSYQVCLPAGSDGGCFPDLTIQALEHAIEHGVNVINYSVGGGADSPWEATDSLAFLNARVAGLHVATSAGNSGPGPETIGAPGNAPWITTVAAYTHDRAYADKQLTGFSGGDSTPVPMDGKGATLAYSGPIVDAANYGDGNCNNAFPADTFNGEIVLCRRGDIARVAKGSNVLSGGAGGLVLVNLADGAQNIEADLHVLPAIQLNATDGETLINWLASGSDHQVTIEASAMVKDPELGDIAGDFTSRGPNVPYPTSLAPDLAAPGVDIMAAHTTEWPYVETQPPEYTFMSGTSMASPHVAGALALVTALRPDWTPAQVQSALMSTAKVTTYTDDDYDGVKTDSTPFDAGTGRIQVAEAVKAGLLMDVSEAEYLAADPALGGDPADLNLPSLMAVECVVSCNWTRTVTATSAGTWTTSPDYQSAGFDITVSPSSFTLQSGESQELTISATANANLASEWVFGRVLLNRSGLPQQHLTAAINFTGGTAPVPDPDSRGPVISAHRDVDSHRLEGFVTIGTDNLQLTPYGMTKVAMHTAETLGDESPTLPVNDLDNVHSVAISTNADTRLLSAWITEADAPDLDLYIVRDADLNGVPSQVELNNASCISGRVDSQESCVIEHPTPGSYLVVVHNFAGTEAGQWDSHTVAVASAGKSEGNFSLSAPTSVAPNEAFAVDLHWNEPMEAGDVYYGAFTIGTHPDLPENIGMVQFELHRGADDVALSVDSTAIKAGEPITYSIELMANPGAVDRHYTLTSTLPQGFSVTEAEGAEVDGDQISWSVVQVAGGDSQTLTLVVDSSAVVTETELALSLSHRVNEMEAVTDMAPSVTVAGRPTAQINGESELALEVQSPATVELSAEGSQGAEGETLSYQWQQLSGPTLTLSGSDSETLSITVPALSSDQQAEIALVVITESGTSLPVVATLNLAAEPVAQPGSGGGSGGSMGWFALLLLGAALGRRR
ncbi:S8 family serine peptidase [Ferrimonas balearica]|uniref:S8 family serine peptidase n=1 Tax=Ferrimonas balearica TaxID=44012 RepID=UPI001C99E403|nr:S8 family serine peptidase [Ferrimonas balearica]MBY5923391.1 S8 family serine peptidase [Ferrimonas balearica]MBY5995141.1 S8 family serine peptidase [Ferrimonas balearica]